MAATGFTPIKIYASSTASNVPLAANLDNTNGAELAINTADGRLFYKDSAGNVQTMASKATGSIGGSTTQVQFNNAGALGGSASLTWSGTVLTSSGFSGPLNGTVGATTANTGAFTSLTTTGTINLITVGRGAGAVATNTAVGASALAANTSGANNVALGATALTNNTSGDLNVAIGGREQAFNSWGPMRSNTTGYHNVAVGAGSLASNTSGSANSALGYTALFGNTTGTNNVAIGWQSLLSNTTASNNTAVGCQAAYTNTTGTALTAVGRLAMYSNTTGVANTAIGADYPGVSVGPLQSNTTGSQNVAVGTGALGSNTTASNNTAVGYQAGYSNTTGSSHTTVGYQSGYSVTTGTDNTFIGNIAGNAGGTATTTGIANTYVGSASRGSAATNNREIVIGFNVAGQGTNTVTLGSDSGKIYNSFTVNATWTQTSDGRMKTNIQDDSLGLSFINRLRPVKFTWKPSNELEQDNPYYAEENKRDTTTVIHGLIAQDVKAALDAEGVDTFAGWDMGADGIQAISREMFISPLINAVKELKAEVDSLKSQLKGA